MKFLAWDTSSKVGALAALEWDPKSDPTFLNIHLVSEWMLNVDATHSEGLLWGIHHLLEASKWKLEDVDVFIVGEGPGSFTGLRIGITTARTLADTLGKPLVGVSSLAVLARPAAEFATTVKKGRNQKSKSNKSDPIVIAATNAFGGELFALWGAASAVAKCAKMDGLRTKKTKQTVKEEALTPEDFLKALKKPIPEWLLVGEAKTAYPELWKKLPASKQIAYPTIYSHQIQGRYVGLLGIEAYHAGFKQKALDVKPRYLRGSTAEVKLKRGELKPQPVAVD